MQFSRLKKTKSRNERFHLVPPLCSISTVLLGVHGASKKRVSAGSTALVKVLVGLTTVEHSGQSPSFLVIPPSVV